MPFASVPSHVKDPQGRFESAGSFIYRVVRSNTSMAHRAIVLGVAALLVVVSLFAVVAGATPVSDARASPTAAVVPAVAPVVELLDQTHGYMTTFEPGQTNSRVYFYITDPNHDPALTVRVFDTNATRDGLTNPVATWSVNLTSGTYDSTVTGLEYTIPMTLAYGGTWNLTVDGSTGGNVTAPFDVQTYEVSLTGSPVSVLAGHPGTVRFAVTSLATGLPYTEVTSVLLSANYYDGATTAFEPLPLSVTSFGAGVTAGTASFLLPANASRDGYISILALANVSSHGNYSVTDNGIIDIANYYSASIYGSCNCIGNAIVPNSQVVLSVYVYEYSYQVEPAPYMNVTFSFWNGANRVANSSVPGNPPKALTTDLNGQASIVFFASPTVFSTSALNSINVSVLAVPSVFGSVPVYDNYSFPFAVLSNATSAGATLTASFSAPSYTGGDAGTATWQVTPVGSGTGWTAVSYQLSAYYSGTYNLFQTGSLSGLAGTIPFTAPTNLSAAIQLVVVAQNGATVIEYTASAEVTPATIFLTASEVSYHAGDTVQFSVQTIGSSFATATLYYTVYSYTSGLVLASGTVTGGSFSYTVPAGGVAPTEIEALVVAQSPTLGLFASASYYVSQAAGITVTAGISTVSHYSDGSFQPGQTLTVTWTYSVYGPVQASTSYWVNLWNADGWYGDAPPLSATLTSSTSGTFQYTIPSGSAAGAQSLYVELDRATTCTNACYSVAQVSFTVNPSPSALNLELGAGSGLTVGWLILLIVIVVVAVLLVLVMRRGRAPKSPASTYSATTGSMSPPAPAPSTPPAAEWKESPTPPPGNSTSPAAGGAPPPLPTPPTNV